jgi:hypothetical protein
MSYNIVQELDNDFIMVAHPFPQIQGEMLLFQHKNIDDNMLVYKDYSLLKRQKMPAIKPKQTTDSETK